MIVRSLLTALGFDVDKKAVQSYDKALQGVFTVTRLVGAASIAMGAAFLKSAGDMEQTEIAFETMLGSAEDADKLIKEITNFAASTPFELKGLVDNSKKLLAFGIEADNIIDTMTNLGNISAGVGRDKLPSIVLAFGKIRTKGKATMEELNILLEAGVPILDELAGNMGVTTKELFKLVSAGKVGFEEVDDALRGLSTGSGKFSGLMEKQSKSFLGIISNIGDFIEQFAIAVGQDLLPMAKEIAKAFLVFFEANKKIIQSGIVKFFKGLVRVIAWVFILIKKLIERLSPLIKKWLESFKVTDKLKDSFKGLVGSIANFIKQIVRVIGFVGQAVSGFFKLGQESGFIPAILDLIAAAFDQVSATVKFIIDILKFLSPVLTPIIKVLLWIGGLWIKLFTGMSKNTTKFINGIVPKLKAFVGGIVGIFKFLANIGKAIWGGFAKVVVGIFKFLVGIGKKIWGGFFKGVKFVFMAFAAFFVYQWRKIKGAASAIWKAIVSVGTKVWKAFVGFLTNLFAPYVAYLKRVWEGIKSVVVRAWNSIIAFGVGVWKAFVGWLSGIWEAFTTALSNIWNGIKSAIVGVWNSIVAVGTQVWMAFVGWLTGLWQGFTTFLGGVWDSITNIFSTAINAIINFFKPLTDAISNVANMIKDGLLAEINKFKAAFESVKNFFGGGKPKPPPPGATAGRAVGSSSSSSVNVKSNINLAVPAGTTEEQQAVLRDSADKAFAAQWEAVMRGAQSDNPPVDFVR